jgi:hypothetical protein
MKVFLLSVFALTVSLNFATLPVQAADRNSCTPVDLRPEMGPVRDQGDIGWCYANAAADLLTYKYRDALAGKQISADYVALTYTHFFEFNPYGDGGLITFAALSSMQHGMCSEDVQDSIVPMGERQSLESKLDDLQNLKTLYDQNKISELNTRLQDLKVMGSPLGALPRSDLDNVLAHSSSHSFALKIADLLCRGHRTRINFQHWAMPRTMFASLNENSSHPKLFAKIDKLLNDKNPVGFGYFADFLQHENASREGGHASVLVGRRWSNDKNTCEYLIRNSWGPGCDGYTPEITAECEDGNLWVTRATLAKYIDRITWLRK